MGGMGTILLDEHCYERKFQWSSVACADAWGGMLVSFEARGVSDVSMAITDDTEVGGTRDEAQALAPAYLLRFANYRNSRTCLEQRNKGRVQERTHGKLLHESRFVLLWANLIIDKRTGRTHISAGTGAPSPTTCLISYTAEACGVCLSRIGFTTWDRGVEIKNLRAVHHLSQLRQCPCTAVATEPATNGEVWTRGTQVAVHLAAAEAPVCCSLLALRCSSDSIRRVVDGDAAAAAGAFFGAWFCEDALALHLPGVAPAVFQEWYWSVTHGVPPPLSQCNVFGTDGRHLRKAQLLSLVADCHGQRRTDLTLRVVTRAGAAAVGAHEAVLTSLEFFACMLRHPFRETVAREVEFAVDGGDEGAAVVDVLVKGLYAVCLGYALPLDLGGLATPTLLCLAEEFQKLGLRDAVGMCEARVVERVAEPLEMEELSAMAGVSTALGLLRLRNALVAKLADHLARMDPAGAGAPPGFLTLPRDILVEALRVDAAARDDAALCRTLRAYLAAHGLTFDCGAPSEGSLWAHEVAFAVNAPLHACSEACIYAARGGRKGGGESAEAAAAPPPPRRVREFTPASGGVLAYLRQRCAQNIARAKVVTVATSSPKNPLSAGWKLFSTPKMLSCGSTETHPVPFAAITLPFALVLSGYKVTLRAAEGAAAWELHGRPAAGGDWRPLDASAVQPRGAGQAVELRPAGEYTAFRVSLTDGGDHMTLTHIDFYGTASSVDCDA